jgi:hypothetical protein
LRPVRVPDLLIRPVSALSAWGSHAPTVLPVGTRLGVGSDDGTHAVSVKVPDLKVLA